MTSTWTIVRNKYGLGIMSPMPETSYIRDQVKTILHTTVYTHNPDQELSIKFWSRDGHTTVEPRLTWLRSRSPIVTGWSNVSHFTKCWSNVSLPTFDQHKNDRLTSMLVTHCECTHIFKSFQKERGHACL